MATMQMMQDEKYAHGQRGQALPQLIAVSATQINMNKKRNLRCADLTHTKLRCHRTAMFDV
ncbi:hypothetical protein DBR37_12435 [Herminiimonas sp. KBW02]|uniref:hypothetical protein n=1 Tax=Herminiimonas sp. KBW02 TaxID=2153363 RepID=UPI000F5B0171|nr:hypothetical protein [Herminiimonas sp. KBW02]RQO33932.1 hypothetical protein DBR37_12435 [Herminiimonas sp. KBW02]